METTLKKFEACCKSLWHNCAEHIANVDSGNTVEDAKRAKVAWWAERQKLQDLFDEIEKTIRPTLTKRKRKYSEVSVESARAALNKYRADRKANAGEGVGVGLVDEFEDEMEDEFEEEVEQEQDEFLVDISEINLQKDNDF